MTIKAPDSFFTEGKTLIDLTASIISAYVGKNEIKQQELPSLIKTVHETLNGLDHSAPSKLGLKPAVTIEDSVTDDFLICLEDGFKFKSLRRHLRTKYDLSPEDYREKWGLPNDYPMVAPSYARLRSDLAKQMRFGQNKK